MLYLTNAFSLNMLPGLLPQRDGYLGHPARIEVIPLDEVDVVGYMETRSWMSAVGHADTAAVFGDVLGIPVPANRVTVSINEGDWLLVGQYSGPRLEEGATTLPEGAAIRWFSVEVRQYDAWDEWENSTVFEGPHEGE